MIYHLYGFECGYGCTISTIIYIEVIGRADGHAVLNKLNS